MLNPCSKLRLAVAAALLLATAPVASAQPAEHLRFRASPARAGAPVTLQFTFGTTATWSTSRFGFDLPRAVWHGAQFPKCRLRTLTRERSAKACPRGSRVGRGRALLVHGHPTVRLEERFRVTAINGGERLHMIWEGKPVPPSPTGRTLIWSGRPDGPDITEWLPTDPVEIMGGLTATMEQFKMRLGATDGELGLVEFPRCKRGQWRATAYIRYFDSANPDDPERGFGRASDSVPCSE